MKKFQGKLLSNIYKRHLVKMNKLENLITSAFPSHETEKMKGHLNNIEFDVMKINKMINTNMNEFNKKLNSKNIVNIDELKEKDIDRNIKINDVENNNYILNNISSNSKINKGIGAGGANTNKYGLEFEEKTNNEPRMIKLGFTKYLLNTQKSKTKNDSKQYYLKKEYPDKTVIYAMKNNFKLYLKKYYDLDIFRCPDEAYIIEFKDGNIVVNIIEKKEQSVDGSVETKLWSSPSLKREYELVMHGEVKVNYCLCVNGFYKEKFEYERKFKLLKTILDESDIDVLYGDDNDYFDKLDEWLQESMFQ